MSRTEEEARAAAYRGQTATRRAFRRMLRSRLAGDAAAARNLRAGWAPIVDLERDELRRRGENP